MATVAHPALKDLWEFQAVLQFSHLFGPALDINRFASSQLVEALSESTSQQAFLGELVCKLLGPPVEPETDVSISQGWQDKLRQLLAGKWQSIFESNPLQESDFASLTPETKAEVLFALCYWRMEEDSSLQDGSKDISWPAVTYKPELVGVDCQGKQLYLIINETECKLWKKSAVYTSEEKQEGNNIVERQESTVSVDSETVCETLREVAEFVKKLSTSDNSADAAVHKKLSEVLSTYDEVAAASRLMQEKIAFWEKLQRHTLSKRRSRPAEMLKHEACVKKKPNLLPSEKTSALPGMIQPSHDASKAAFPDVVNASQKQLSPKPEIKFDVAKQVGLVDKDSLASGCTIQDGDRKHLQTAAAGSPSSEPPTAADASIPLQTSEAERKSGCIGEASARMPSQDIDGSQSLPSHTCWEEIAERAAANPPASLTLQSPATATAIAVKNDGPFTKDKIGTAEKTDALSSIRQAAQPVQDCLPQALPADAAAAASRQTPVPRTVSGLDGSSEKVSARPQRSSRSATNPRYQDYEDVDDIEAAQPPTKRQAIGRGVEETFASKISVARAASGRQQQPEMAASTFRALYPSAIDLPAPRRRRSCTPRQPRSSRASINRLKQAAHGTLPLGMKKARASLYVVAGGLSPGASGSESEADVAEQEDSSEFSDSEADSDAPRRSKKGRGRRGGSYGQQYSQQPQQRARGFGHERGMQGGCVQTSALSLQQQQQMLMANANPQMRAALLQRMMQQQPQRAGPPLFSQLSQDQQRAIAAQFLQQLAPAQQQQVRQLPQDQLMHLLQNYYQSKVLAGQQQQPGGIGGVQLGPQQDFGQPGPHPSSGNMSDQQKLAVVISNLSPEARAQLQSLPPDQQRLVLAQLLQRHQLAEQQQQQQEQHMMRQHNMGMAGMSTQLGRGTAMTSGMGQFGMQQQPARVPGMQTQSGRGRAEEALHDMNWFLNDS